MEIPNHFPILNSSKKITDLGARRNPQLLIFNSYFLFFSAFIFVQFSNHLFYPEVGISNESKEYLAKLFPQLCSCNGNGLLSFIMSFI